MNHVTHVRFDALDTGRQLRDHRAPDHEESRLPMIGFALFVLVILGVIAGVVELATH